MKSRAPIFFAAAGALVPVVLAGLYIFTYLRIRSSIDSAVAENSALSRPVKLIERPLSEHPSHMVFCAPEGSLPYISGTSECTSLSKDKPFMVKCSGHSDPITYYWTMWNDICPYLLSRKLFPNPPLDCKQGIISVLQTQPDSISFFAPFQTQLVALRFLYRSIFALPNQTDSVYVRKDRVDLVAFDGSFAWVRILTNDGWDINFTAKVKDQSMLLDLMDGVAVGSCRSPYTKSQLVQRIHEVETAPSKPKLPSIQKPE